MIPTDFNETYVYGYPEVYLGSCQRYQTYGHYDGAW